MNDADAEELRTKKGSYGIVHLDQKLNVAKKQMPFDHGEEIPSFALRELGLLRKCERLRIPHMIRLQGFELHNTKLTLIFPLYRQCLYSFLSKEVNRPERLRVAKLALVNVLEALAYMHHYNILYRDCKPGNMLLSFDRKTVVLTDLGGSREVFEEDHSADEKVGLSKDVCTHIYAAPEVMTDKYGPKCDIYALGVSVIQIMTGQLMDNEFLWEKAANAAQPRETAQMTRLKRKLTEIQPGRVELMVLLKMVAQDPRDRPTALECLHLLRTKFAFEIMPDLPAFPGKYWLKNKNVRFDSTQRAQLVRYICDASIFCKLPKILPAYMVHLFDEFLTGWDRPLRSQQLMCLAAACIFIILKYASQHAFVHSAEQFVQFMNLGDKFTSADLLSWESLVLKRVQGNIIPRPLSRAVSLLSMKQMRNVLMHEDYVVGGTEVISLAAAALSM